MSREAENKIVVKNLSKTFDMYNSPMDKLKEALSPRGKIRHTEFHALTDLSFNVKKERFWALWEEMVPENLPC